MSDNNQTYDRTVVSALVTETNELTEHVIQLLKVVTQDTDRILLELSDTTQKLDKAADDLEKVEQETLGTINGALEDMNDIYNQFLAESTALKNDLANVDKDIQGVSIRVDDLDDRAVVLEGQTTNLEAKTTALTNSVDTADLRLRFIQGETNTLDEKVTQMKADVIDLTAKVEANDISLDQMEATLASMISDVGSLTVEVNDNTAKVNALELQVNSLNQTATTAMNTATAAKDLADSTNDQATDLDNRLTTMDLSVENLETITANFESRMTSLENRSDSLVATMAQLDDDVDALQAQINNTLTSLSDQVAALNARVSPLETSVSSLETRANDLDVNYSDLNTRIATDIENATEATKAVVTATDQLRVQLTDSEAAYNNYATKAAEAAADLATMDQTIDQYEADTLATKNDAISQFNTMKAEAQTLNDNTAVKHSEVVTMRDEVQTDRDHIDAQVTHVDAQRAHVDQRATEIDGEYLRLEEKAADTTLFEGKANTYYYDDGNVNTKLNAAKTVAGTAMYDIWTEINSINTLLTSDNTDLDSLQEIVDYIEQNKANLDTLGISNIAGLQTALDSKLGLHATADAAQKWETARLLTLGGDVTGSVSVDGTQDITVTVTVQDDSHNHVISNVDGLQAALDSKSAVGHTHSYLPLAGGVLTGDVAAPKVILTNASGGIWWKGDVWGVDGDGTVWTHGKDGSGDNMLSQTRVGASDYIHNFYGQLKENGQRVYGPNNKPDWTEVENKPETATRWPSYAEITDRPSDYPSAPHGHGWSEIYGKPATYPATAHTHLWADLTDKPTTFPPSAHNHYYVLDQGVVNMLTGGERPAYSGISMATHGTGYQDAAGNSLFMRGAGDTELSISYNESDFPTVRVRGRGGSANWSSWNRVVTESGGVAQAARYLYTARTISLTGDVTGSVDFDGSGNVSIPVTIADDSHNHTVANVDGLQDVLNSKAPNANPVFTGNAILNSLGYYQAGTNGSGQSAIVGTTQHKDDAVNKYRAYLAYDAYWDETNDQWKANRTTLGRKWMLEMGYHDSAFHVRHYDGDPSAPWRDDAWDSVLYASMSDFTWRGKKVYHENHLPEISEVVGLQTALDAKMPKSGGQFTGDISIVKGANVNSSFGIYESGGIHGFGILYDGEASNVTHFRTVNDGNAVNFMSIGRGSPIVDFKDVPTVNGVPLLSGQHNHDSEYLALAGGTLTGDLNLASTYAVVSPGTGGSAHFRASDAYGFMGFKRDNATWGGYLRVGENFLQYYDGATTRDVYHTGNKPTAGDVGAATAGHDHAGVYSPTSHQHNNLVIQNWDWNDQTSDFRVGSMSSPAGSGLASYVNWIQWGHNGGAKYRHTLYSFADGVGMQQLWYAYKNNSTDTSSDATSKRVVLFGDNIGTGATEYAAGNHTHSYLPLTGGTLTGSLTAANVTTTGDVVANRVRPQSGQQLVLSAGESHSYAPAQSAEYVYVNAEGGLEVNSSPDNWGSGWANRNTVRLAKEDGTSDFSGSIKTKALEYNHARGGWFFNNWTTNTSRGIGLYTNEVSGESVVHFKSVMESNPTAAPSMNAQIKLGASNGGWNQVYHQGFKPSPADIGAATSGHQHTGLRVSAWNGIKSSTSHGYIEFGPANTSHAHIYTDRPNFYFNKEIRVNNVALAQVDAFWDFTKINGQFQSNQNVNSYQQGRFYGTSVGSSGTSLGAPGTYSYVVNLGGNGVSYGLQLATHYGSGKYLKFRRRSDNVSSENGQNQWQPWYDIYHSGNTNIGTGATNYAAGNHTHSYLPLAGGTLTGALALPAISNSLTSGGKEILSTSDSWLRINDSNAFTSGIYTGSSLVRMDGSLQVGVSATDGLYVNNGAFNYKGNAVYHAGNKPTPAAIGAAASSHSHSYTDLNHFRSLGTVYLDTSATTADFIAELESKGAFDSYHSTMKCAWSYAGNSDLNTGIGTIELAGSVIECWTDNASDSTRGNITVRITSPNTGTGAGSVYVYNDQGSSYSPGWRKIYNSRTPPSASDVGAATSSHNHDSVYYKKTDTVAAASWADQCDVNSSGSSSWYGMVWHSGDTLYTTNHSSSGKWLYRPSDGYMDIYRGHIRLRDNMYMNFGTSSDASLFCSGNHMYMNLNSGIGNFYIRDGSTTRFTFDDAGHFTATGNIGAYSDIKVKTNLEIIEGAMDRVRELTGYTYDRTDYETTRQTGLVAQEVQKVLPEAVTVHVDDQGEETLTLAYGNLAGLFVEAIKEQDAVIQEQRAEIEELKDRMARMEAALEKLLS